MPGRRVLNYDSLHSTGTQEHFLQPINRETGSLIMECPAPCSLYHQTGPILLRQLYGHAFPTSGNANNQVRPGTIAAYRANDVSAGELWNSDQNKADVIGNFAKFNTPTIANGKVFVPTFSKAIKFMALIVRQPVCNMETGMD